MMMMMTMMMMLMMMMMMMTVLVVVMMMLFMTWSHKKTAPYADDETRGACNESSGGTGLWLRQIMHVVMRHVCFLYLAATPLEICRNTLFLFHVLKKKQYL